MTLRNGLPPLESRRQIKRKLPPETNWRSSRLKHSQKSEKSCTPWATFLEAIESAAHPHSDTATTKSSRFHYCFGSLGSSHQPAQIYLQTEGTTPPLPWSAKWWKSSISRGPSIVAIRTQSVGFVAPPTSVATSSPPPNYDKRQAGSSEGRTTDITVNSEDILCRVLSFYSRATK